MLQIVILNESQYHSQLSYRCVDWFHLHMERLIEKSNEVSNKSGFSKQYDLCAYSISCSANPYFFSLIPSLFSYMHSMWVEDCVNLPQISDIVAFQGHLME